MQLGDRDGLSYLDGASRLRLRKTAEAATILINLALRTQASAATCAARRALR